MTTQGPLAGPAGHPMPKQRGRFRSRRFDRKRFLAYQVVGFFAACLLLHVGYNSDKYLPTSVTQAAGLRGSGNVVRSRSRCQVWATPC